MFAKKKDFQTDGVLSLCEIQLNSTHVSRLLPDVALFHIEADIPNQQHSELLQLNCLSYSTVCSQFITVTFSAENCSDSDLDLAFEIQPHEDIGNGMRNTDIRDKLVWVGSLSAQVVSVCFFIIF